MRNKTTIDHTSQNAISPQTSLLTTGLSSNNDKLAIKLLCFFFIRFVFLNFYEAYGVLVSYFPFSFYLSLIFFISDINEPTKLV